MARRRRSTNPILNIFWLLLFAPVVWILTRLWKNDLPWMNNRPTE